MEPYAYRIIRFWILIVCQILSILFSVLVFVCLLKSGELNTQRLHNHAIIAILVTYFLLLVIELPITLAFAYRGYVLPSSPEFCSFWIGCNYGLFAIGSYLLAFASIERYFLIFHDHFVRSWRHLVHYPPMAVCILYPILFYSLMITVSPCQNTYNYERYLCGNACYQQQLIEGTIDWIFNGSLPIVVIALINVVLAVRVTCQKRSIRMTNQWRKIRLMYIQLLSVSMIYCCIWIPFMIISLIQIFVDPTFCRDVTRFLLNYTLYICPLVSPFLCLAGLPTVRQQVIAVLRIPQQGYHRNRNQVIPRTITTMRMNKTKTLTHQLVDGSVEVEDRL